MRHCSGVERGSRGVTDCDDPNLLLARYDRVVNQIGKLRHYVFADASFLRNSDAWEAADNIQSPRN
jgi:hypothetical protein